MRLFVGVVLLGTVAASHAEASSFVVLGAPTKTPSIVTFGAPAVVAKAEPKPTQKVASAGRDSSDRAFAGKAPKPQVRKISMSVIAMGEPAPAVSKENVAAIDKKSAPKSTPMLIRGGLFGEASLDSTPQSAGPRKLSRPEQRKLERDRRRAAREGKALPSMPYVPRENTAKSEPEPSTVAKPPPAETEVQ